MNLKRYFRQRKVSVRTLRTIAVQICAQNELGMGECSNTSFSAGENFFPEQRSVNMANMINFSPKILKNDELSFLLVDTCNYIQKFLDSVFLMNTRVILTETVVTLKSNKNDT